MRILHVVPCYLPGRRYGGPIASVHGLGMHLVARGHSVTVFTTDQDGFEPLAPPASERAVIDGVEIRYHAARAPRRIHRAPSMRAALRERIGEFDVCHLHGLYSWPSVCAAREAERAGVPYVVSPRGMLVRDLIRRRGAARKRLWLAAFDRRTLERAAWIHATAEAEAADLAAFPFRWPPVVAIPNGVEPVEFDGDLATVTPRVREALVGDDAILFVGRLDWKKGLDRLVRALARMERGRLVVAGPDHGYGQELRRLVREHRLESRVTLLGEVAGRDKAALLAHARVLALASHHENFGNVVLEAMSAGLPVVVSQNVGTAALVRESGAGRVVEGDFLSLSRALTELVAQPDLCHALGEAGQRTARERFAWPAIAERFERLYAKRANDVGTAASSGAA